MCIFTLISYGQDHTEFLYPVAQIDEENLLILHQKSFDDIELWRWNKNEKIAFKELSSIFLPSFIQLLPSKSACSFVDRGRIKIKYFAKRTPRSIDIYEPISAISGITWLDDEHFYFVGKHEGNFKIFLCNISDHHCIISCLSNLNDNLDYLYPQKINNFLFCITKDRSKEYAICKLEWNPKIYKNELLVVMQARHEKFEQCDETLVNASSSKIVLLKSLKPLCFLHMQDQNFGFVLEFDHENQQTELFTFSCCKLEKELNQAWSINKLFDFQLPKNLFVGSEHEKIYESIFPFLPIYAPDFIYFVHFDQDIQACQIMRYNRNLKMVENITQNFVRSSLLLSNFFAPFLVNDLIYAGIFAAKSIRGCNFMHIDQTTGIFQCQLPEIKL